MHRLIRQESSDFECSKCTVEGIVVFTMITLPTGLWSVKRHITHIICPFGLHSPPGFFIKGSAAQRSDNLRFRESFSVEIPGIPFSGGGDIVGLKSG